MRNIITLDDEGYCSLDVVDGRRYFDLQRLIHATQSELRVAELFEDPNGIQIAAEELDVLHTIRLYDEQIQQATPQSITEYLCEIEEQLGIAA